MSQGFKNIISFIIPSGFRLNNTIIAENDLLRTEVLRLTSLNADRGVLMDENLNLKYMMGRGSNAINTSVINAEGVLGVIKGRPAETPFDTFVIDVGVDEGVVVGDSVYYGSLIIGNVVESGSLFSKVKLFSSPGNVFSGTLSSSNIKIEAKGLGGGSFEALVPLGVDVQVGDSFVLPSISSKVFGIIQSIEEQQSEGFKRLLFTLPVNPNHITSVLVVK